MKICKQCGSREIKANIDPKYVVISGSLRLEDERVLELYKERGLNQRRDSILRDTSIEVSKEFDPTNPEYFSNVRCGACEGVEFEEVMVCPACGDKNQEDLYWCSYESRIMCGVCRDSWSCRNECEDRKCPFNPRYKGKKKPEPKEVKPVWLQPDWEVVGGAQEEELEEEPRNPLDRLEV